MVLFVIGPEVHVHRLQRNGVTCPTATRSLNRHLVSLNQCLVYKLPSCPACWVNVRDYDNFVQRGF